MSAAARGGTRRHRGRPQQQQQQRYCVLLLIAHEAPQPLMATPLPPQALRDATTCVCVRSGELSDKKCAARRVLL